MSKKDIIKELQEKTIHNIINPILSQSEVKILEQAFKAHANEYDNVEDFAKDFGFEFVLTNRYLQAVKYEIDNRLKTKQALQPGIINECVICGAFAKYFGLPSFINLQTTPYADIPSHVREYLNTKNSPRYTFYKKSDISTIVAQHGNPNGSDAEIIIDGHIIRCEIKDQTARLSEKDVTYDEDGKLIVTEDLNELPIYVEAINVFNIEESILTCKGNYKIDPSSIDIKQVAPNADMLITTLPEDNGILAIDVNNLDKTFDDGTFLLDVTGSEIRRTGKNATPKIFTPKYLEKSLKETKIEVNDDICRVYKNDNNIEGFVTGRGKSVVTRLKINAFFYVDIDNVTETDEYYEFPKNKIKQTKAGISVHIKINKSREFLQNNL